LPDTVVKSKTFGDVEEEVVNKVKKQCDFNRLYKDMGYKKIITNYPCISEQKKENLITEIAKRNNRLEKARTPDFEK